MTDHAHARIGRQNSLEAHRSFWCSVGDNDLTGVLGVTYAHASAMME